MRFINFIWVSIVTCLKYSFSLKLNLFFSIILIGLRQFAFLFAWRSFFKNFTSIGGWDFNDFILMYGIVAISAGITDLFFFGLRELPNIIESKRIDYLLIQPKNIILKIAISKIEISGIGEVITGFLLILYSGYFSKFPFYIFLIIILTSIIVFSLYLYLSCIAFFIKNAESIVMGLRGICFIASGQPNSGYSGFLKFITCSILPVAFWSFFPVEFIRTGNLKFLIITFLGTFSLLFVTIIIFNLGIRRYKIQN
ncbi:MAG: hypothetical protein GY830_03650 [Bacteroidetes bacterium]|nr:hypothetical protein [Bacteroidota bacterium]